MTPRRACSSTWTREFKAARRVSHRDAANGRARRAGVAQRIPPSATLRRVVTRPTRAGHGLPAIEAINVPLHDAATRRMRAKRGPSDAACGRVRRMARGTRASSPRRHRDVPSANPGGRERIRSTWTCGGRVRGVAFSLVPFSWPHKRKSPARPGGAREKTRMSCTRYQQRQNRFRVPRYARPRNGDERSAGVARRAPSPRDCVAALRARSLRSALRSEGGEKRQLSAPWQCLYFLPEPHGQGSLRPTLGPSRTIGAAAAATAAPACWPSPSAPSCGIGS